MIALQRCMQPKKHETPLEPSVYEHLALSLKSQWKRCVLHAELEVLYLIKCRVTIVVTTLILCLPECNCWQRQ